MMRNRIILFVHLIATLARLLGPDGIRSVVAESVLAKQQLLILNRSRQRQANLRILQVTEIKTVPYVPLSHPFVERLIGTIRREYLDPMWFWTTADLENKLLDFRIYFNEYRSHTGLEGRTPDLDAPMPQPIASLHSYGWQRHCRGLFHHPIAA